MKRIQLSSTVNDPGRAWPTIPTCWPDAAGRCGCGRGHASERVGKSPLVKWSPFIATPPNKERQAAWRQRWPYANRALLLEPAGVLVIDCDGDEALSEATGYGLPQAIVAASGRGGHYYYRAPEAVRGKSTTKRGHSRAIDVLAGGLVTIPPSRHRSGRTYRWIVSPDQRALTEPPAWAVVMLDEASSVGHVLDVYIPDTLPDVQLEGLRVSARIKRLIFEGTEARYRSRSEAVFACIQALIASGYDNAIIVAVLEDVANGISSKPRELGRRWVVREIARARAKSDVEVFA